MPSGMREPPDAPALAVRHPPPEYASKPRLIHRHTSKKIRLLLAQWGSSVAQILLVENPVLLSFINTPFNSRDTSFPKTMQAVSDAISSEMASLILFISVPLFML